jgi:hypothetical protein
MKTNIILASIFLSSFSFGDTVERKLLDPDKAIEISVGTKTATTLQFPRSVRGIFGYGLTQGDAPGTYQYDHPNGARVMTLRNLMPDKEAFVTVLLGESDLYVLHLKPTATPPVAVHLLDPAASKEQWLARPVDAEEAKARRLIQSTDRLFNLLKLGKNERVFRAALPHLYKDAESRTVEFRHDDEFLATVVTEVHRFPSEDAIFIGGAVINSTDEVQFIDPASFEVRVGSRTYPVALVDCAETIPPKGSVPIHAILRGGAEGERANLSLKNEFRLVLPAYNSETEDPALTDELGLVVQPEGEPRIDPTLFDKQSTKNPIVQPENTSSK